MKNSIKSSKKSIQVVKSSFSRFYITVQRLIKIWFIQKRKEAIALMKSEKITVWAIYREYKKQLGLAKGEKMGDHFKRLLNDARETKKAIENVFTTGCIKFYEKKIKGYTTRLVGCIKELGDYSSISKGCLRLYDKVKKDFISAKLEFIERVTVMQHKDKFFIVK